MAMGAETSKDFYEGFLGEMKKAYDPEKIKGVQPPPHDGCVSQTMIVVQVFGVRASRREVMSQRDLKSFRLIYKKSFNNSLKNGIR